MLLAIASALSGSKYLSAGARKRILCLRKISIKALPVGLFPPTMYSFTADCFLVYPRADAIRP